MVPPGDVSLVSRIATEQAVSTVLTHARQCTVFPKQLSLSQPQSTAANHNQLQPRKGAQLIFLKSSVDYWEKVHLIPLLRVRVADGGLTGKAPVVTF